MSNRLNTGQIIPDGWLKLKGRPTQGSMLMSQWTDEHCPFACMPSHHSLLSTNYFLQVVWKSFSHPCIDPCCCSPWSMLYTSYFSHEKWLFKNKSLYFWVSTLNIIRFLFWLNVWAMAISITGIEFISDALQYECLSPQSLSHNVHFIHFHSCHLTDTLSLAFSTNLVHVQPFSHYASQTETSFYLCRFAFLSSPQLFSSPYLHSFAYFRFIFWTQYSVCKRFSENRI